MSLMDLTTKFEIADSVGPEGDPYITVESTRIQKAFKILAAWIVPVLSILFISQTREATDSLLRLTWFPLLSTGLAAWYSREVWRAGPMRILHKIPHRIKPVNAPKKVIYSTLLVSAICALIYFSAAWESEVEVFIVLMWPVVVYLVYLIMLFRPQYSHTFTPAAKAEYAKLEYAKAEALQREQNEAPKTTWIDEVAEDLWARWYFRYVTGMALFWVAFEFANSDSKNGWIFAILIGIAGLGCVAEVAVWCLGLLVCGGLLYAVMGALAGIPVSAAIIIGAIIIANSRNR